MSPTSDTVHGSATTGLWKSLTPESKLGTYDLTRSNSMDGRPSGTSLPHRIRDFGRDCTGPCDSEVKIGLARRVDEMSWRTESKIQPQIITSPSPRHA